MKEVQTVKNWTEIQFSAVARDQFFGHILMALFGTTYVTIKVPIPGSITGTFVEGETVTETTSNATGVIRRLDVCGTSKVLYVVRSTGTWTGGQTVIAVCLKRFLRLEGGGNALREQRLESDRDVSRLAAQKSVRCLRDTGQKGNARREVYTRARDTGQQNNLYGGDGSR